MKYTKDQIKECKDYLGYGFEEGYFDEEMCHDIINRKAWGEVYDLMGYGEYLADLAKEEGGDL